MLKKLSVVGICVCTLLFEVVSRGRSSYLTADLASASLNEYLNWRFGKPVPVLAFADTDPAKVLFITKKEARALNEQ